MFVSIDGFKGGLTVDKASDANELAVTLIMAGYCVRINALRVNMHYGPGYQYAVFGEGSCMDQSIDPESHPNDY